MNNNQIPNTCQNCISHHRRNDDNGHFFFHNFIMGEHIHCNNHIRQETACVELKNTTDSLFYSYFYDFTTNLAIDPRYRIANNAETHQAINECDLDKIKFILNNSYPVIHDLNYLREISRIHNLTISEIIAATTAAIYYYSQRPFTLDSGTHANVVKFYEFLLEEASCGCDGIDQDINKVFLDRNQVKQRIEGNETIIGPFYLRAHSIILRQHGYSFSINDHIIVTDCDFNKLIKLKVDEPFYCIVNSCNSTTSLNLRIDDTVQCGCKPLLMIPSGCEKPRLLLQDPILSEIHIHVHFDLFRIMLVNNEAISNEPIGHSEFGIFNSRNQLIERLETDTYGVALSNILIDGVYTIKAIKEIPGFIPLDPITIDPPSGQSDFIKKVFIRNYRYNNGSIMVFDTDAISHDPLRLSVFQLMDELNNVLIEKSSCNEGMCIFEHLVPGRYRIRQIVASQGYMVNNKIVSVVLDNDVFLREVRFENTRNPNCCFGRISILKFDRCQESIRLQATFGIYHRNQLIRTITTDSNGRATTALLSNNYEVRELIPPVGYELSTRVRRADLTCFRVVELDVPNRRTPVE